MEWINFMSEDKELYQRAVKAYSRLLLGTNAPQPCHALSTVEWTVDRKAEAVAVITLRNANGELARYGYRLASDRMKNLTLPLKWEVKP